MEDKNLLEYTGSWHFYVLSRVWGWVLKILQHGEGWGGGEKDKKFDSGVLQGGWGWPKYATNGS